MSCQLVIFIPRLRVTAETGAVGSTNLICGKDSASSIIVGAQPLPESPRPCSQITEAVCLLVAGIVMAVFAADFESVI